MPWLRTRRESATWGNRRRRGTCTRQAGRYRAAVSVISYVSRTSSKLGFHEVRVCTGLPAMMQPCKAQSFACIGLVHIERPKGIVWCFESDAPDRVCFHYWYRVPFSIIVAQLRRPVPWGECATDRQGSLLSAIQRATLCQLRGPFEDGASQTILLVVCRWSQSKSTGQALTSSSEFCQGKIESSAFQQSRKFRF
jgi:hypothetical protein